MIRVLFLIRSLDIGGAERQLIYLVNLLDKRRFAVTVATFYDGGALRSECALIPGVRIVSLGKQERCDWLKPGILLLRLVREFRPHIIHGYMGVANELSLAIGRLAGVPVVWGLRSSNMDMTHYDRASAGSFRLSAHLSRHADLLIYNSHAGAEWHRANGYRGKTIVIPNGICTKRFQRNDLSGLKIRMQWGVHKTYPLIGIVARLDPMKDHPTFLRFAAKIAAYNQKVRFVCVGGGPLQYQNQLQKLAQDLGIHHQVIWAGPVTDPVAVYSSLDLLVSSSSFGEGTSNVVAEGMACEVPCVVTNVGDSARMVAGVGLVAPPGNPSALATAAASILDESAEQGRERRQAARDRILANYSLRQLVDKTEIALSNLRS